MSPLLKTPEFKVGLLVLIVSGLIGTMSLKVSESSGFMGGKKLWFTLDNASGLIKNGPVHVAGIRVGVIYQISLDPSGLARVDVVVQPDVKLTKSSKIQVRANGILGDKNIEILPGNPSDPLLLSGDRIEGIEDSASIDKLMSEVGKITKSLSTVADNLRDATEGDDSKPLGKIIKNVESLTGDLAELMRNKKEKFGQIVDNVHAISETLDEVVNDESDEGFKAAWKRIVGRLDNTMKNVDEISEKINSGKGTIGRLINDEETVNELNTAINGVNNLVDAANKLQTSIDFNTNYMSQYEEFRSFFGVTLQPGADRFYELGLVMTPEGDERNIITTTTTGATTVTEDKKTLDKDRLKFTALFGKYFYNFGIKGGVIESTGGFGIEYYMWNRRFKIGVDAFDLEKLRVRPYARLNVFHGLYFMGGGDFMNARGNDGYFVGGGLFLTNDDIKYALQRIQLN